MALLEYRLKAVGEADLARTLASVEQRFAQHVRRINQTLAAGGGSVRRTGSATSVRSMSSDARAALMVERNAMRARLMDQKAAIRLETDAHRRRLRAIETEKRAAIRATAEIARREARERVSARRQFARSVGGGVTAGMGVLGAVGRTGAAMLGVGGSIMAGAAVHEALGLEERIRRFVVAGRSTGSAGMDPNAVRGQVMRTALARGVDPAAVMAGAQQFQTVTGRGDIGLRMADTFATFAQATGGDPTEIADAAAALFQNLKVDDIDALTEALAKLTFQGKKGSFEFKDLAAQLPRVTAGLAGRGIGGGAEGVAKMGAMLQVVQRGTGDAAVTSTAVDALFRQMVAKAKDLQTGKAFGKKVEIFEGGDPTKSLRGDIDKLIADTLLASGGNAIALQKVFGDEGMRGMNMFAAEFKRAGGGQAGHAAVMAMFNDFVEVGGNFAEIQRDAADVQKSTTIELSIAAMELKQVFADELVPVVRDLVPKLRDWAPAVRKATVAAVSLGSTLLDNPLMGLGAIMGAAIALEVGKAQIASSIQSGVLGPLGTLGLAVGGAAAAFVTAKAMVENMFAQAQAKARGAIASGDEVRAQAERELETKGMLSPETRAQLEQLQATERGVFAKADRTVREGTLDTLGRGLRSVGAAVGLNNETGTLGERATIEATAGNMGFVDAAARTSGLLALDDSAKRFATGADMVREQLTAAASEAGDILKKKVSEGALNRSDSPSKPTK